MTDPAILRPDQLPVNDRANGARTIPLVTRSCGSTSLINGITAFDPGAKIGIHFHNCEESVLILEGDAVAEIDGQRHQLRAGDTTWIPANVPHRFLNESQELMRIFWTYATVDATRTMVATGIEQSIDDEHEKAKRA
ncbi:cupin domain-containing protein (plasmid) [Paracoccus liaowanqingii]|uniref:Cupin domain-containing protein n=1 Tax=Paracoccus liaowanqingii TaxID=2560053 RepID=A0A4Y5SVP2_9RHOB|nr:cupin domain-containing protein [Paracoccus liaowanqingii]QDA36938.1 cupin domain-containing protein [Paracoccus liaowanqingii]